MANEMHPTNRDWSGADEVFGHSANFLVKENFQLMRKQKGFSLIELLIVVAIILIIAAIAIPNLLRSRMAANESAAASTIRTLNTAEVAFSTTYASVGYASSLTFLGPNGVDCSVAANVTATSACQIDSVLGCAAATCPKGAYLYSLVPATVAGADYFAWAHPISTAGGNKRFCSLADAVVKFDSLTVTTAPALADCTPPAGSLTALSN
jgi:prepilin-type N-terminal cleavage/methylation domain-containing protein